MTAKFLSLDDRVATRAAKLAAEGQQEKTTEQLQSEALGEMLEDLFRKVDQIAKGQVPLHPRDTKRK